MYDITICFENEQDVWAKKISKYVNGNGTVIIFATSRNLDMLSEKTNKTINALVKKGAKIYQVDARAVNNEKIPTSRIKCMEAIIFAQLNAEISSLQCELSDLRIILWSKRKSYFTTIKKFENQVFGVVYRNEEEKEEFRKNHASIHSEDNLEEKENKKTNPNQKKQVDLGNIIQNFEEEEEIPKENIVKANLKKDIKDNHANAEKDDVSGTDKIEKTLEQENNIFDTEKDQKALEQPEESKVSGADQDEKLLEQSEKNDVDKTERKKSPVCCNLKDAKAAVEYYLNERFKKKLFASIRGNVIIKDDEILDLLFLLLKTKNIQDFLDSWLSISNWTINDKLGMTENDYQLLLEDAQYYYTVIRLLFEMDPEEKSGT